jgi:hypothetical protein
LGARDCLWILLIILALPAIAAPQGGSEITLPEGTRISLQLNDYLSTKLNTQGEEFSATVGEAVYVKERLVIPKGSIVSGTISHLLRPGRFKGKAEMHLLFTAIRIPGSPDTPIVASLVSVGEKTATTAGEGGITTANSKGKDVAKVAAPTIAGAGIGAIAGGGKGAAIGAGIGAAVGLFSGRGTDLELKRGSPMEIALDRPLVLILK